MSSPKVYLSKSKAGDRFELEVVKKELKEYDVEVVEFQGGTYNTELLDNSNYLLVLTPDEELNIGRGQAEEILRAYERDLTILVITDLEPVKVVEITDDDLCFIKKDWQTKWASIELSDYSREYSDGLGDWFEYKEDVDMPGEDFGVALKRVADTYNQPPIVDLNIKTITVDPKNPIVKIKPKLLLATQVLFKL